MKLTVCVDCDDVLLPCNELAIRMLNEEQGLNLSVNDITDWHKSGNASDKRIKYFRDVSFFERQTALPGAREFIHALFERGCDVILLTAVPTIAATQRIQKLRHEFPEVPERNIMIGNRKDICHVDVLLDDAPHNIFDSNAKFPILFRQPWNAHMSGLLSANNYDDVLTIIDRIIAGSLTKTLAPSAPYVFALVGPSGSGKTAIANYLVENSKNFATAQSTTTREKREEEADDAYHFITMEEFQKMRENGMFLETTMYAGNGYGMEKKNIDSLLAEGKNVLVPLDMCGAMAFKSIYGSKCVVCFVKRRKDEVIKAIIERNIPNEDKYNRIISLDDEFKNEALCDTTIQNFGSLKEAAEQLIRIANK